MKHIDVVIIGGSLAGAACARELARQGIDAVAFDRDRFPRDKVCGGFLSPGAVDLLDELDVLEAVRAAGAMPVRSSRIRIGGGEIPVELPKPGLGISRRALDAIMADRAGVQQGFVRDVKRADGGFKVQLESREISASVIVDAAGKLSRLSKRKAVPQFGVQFYEKGSRGEVLDFWFFEEGYGGAVTVEEGRTNACFLVSTEMLPELLGRPSPSGRRWPEGPDEGFSGPGNPSPAASRHPLPLGDGVLVTGPLAYDRLSSDFISIGDAAGMVDPFCGEGMRHALDTGICAARTIATGLNHGDSYEVMRARYEQDSHKRWRGKRRLGSVIRHMLKHPRITCLGLGLNPEFWFRKLWD